MRSVGYRQGALPNHQARYHGSSLQQVPTPVDYSAIKQNQSTVCARIDNMYILIPVV